MLNILNRTIAFIAAGIVALSCSNPLDKSVVEPLTAKEIDRVARKDHSFLATYSVVEEKWNHIHTEEDSLRWKNVTYGRLHNYLAAIESAQLNSPLVIQLRDKWENMYNSHLSDADTVIGRWKNYLAENSIDSLVGISFEGIEIERFRNNNKQVDTLLKAKICITPLKQVIDSISIEYSFSANDTISPQDTSGSANIIVVKKRINQPHRVKVFPELAPQLKRKLVKGDSSVFFTATVKELYCSGKSFSVDSLMMDMPKSVQAYIVAENSIDSLSPVFDQKFYIENIIKEIIDRNFISQSAFIKLNAEDFYREIDTLVFNYLEYNGLQ